MSTDHSDTSKPPSTFVLRSLSLLSLLFSLPACIAVIYFFRRGLPGDNGGGIASALIATVLASGAILGFNKARSENVRLIHDSAPKSKSSNLVIVLVAATIGLISVWGSVGFLWNAAELINQEYLHWFPLNGRRSFGDTSTSAMIWGEFVPMGIFTGAVGGFLLWYVGSSFLRRLGECQSDPPVDQSNPYSPPST